MGLETNTDDSTAENIILGNLARHTEVHKEFVRTNRLLSRNVKWGKEKSEKPDGLRCNFPVILCELEAAIPGEQGAAAKNVTKKRFHKCFNDDRNYPRDHPTLAESPGSTGFFLVNYTT